LIDQISRYTSSLGDEGEFEPGSRGRVLKNLLGITSKREMDRVESEALVQTELHFDKVVTPETIITVELIKEIHLNFFGSIYSWGGKLRGVDISKGGYPFPPTKYLRESLMNFENDTLRRLTPVHPEPSQNVAQAMAEVHAEFLAIHPFREGNGRVARLVAGLMALQASKPKPYYGFTGKNTKAQNTHYLKAVFEGYKQNYEPLARFFDGALEAGKERWLSDFMGSTGR
jgi:cell filamentation protein